MSLIEFKNLPDTSTPFTAENFNNNFEYLESLNNYSTDEIIIGKWIDNKPIYRKVINFGTLPNASRKEVITDIPTNETNIINYYGIAYGTDSNNLKYVLTLPDVDPQGPAQATRLSINTLNGYYNIFIKAGIDRSNYTAHVVLEYTKTTD
jgi:hypothetical protein